MKAARPTAADRIAGTRRPESSRCWLCGAHGVPERTLRADVHVSGHLCLGCWDLQPRGRNPWSRAASALYAALQLPREWHTTGYRSGWLEAAALHHGITAWHDAPQGTALPAEPFAWIPRDALQAAAADLHARAEEFQRSRIAPSARPAGKAGPR
ncbi:hypothetical protein LIX60_25430 [Streptomyces sp. S07_1.15]|uniref:hypothetical protein n=1 Tax=Streptomyces sp. S07_1.15 TaxID=2873925 RepID=UPI001D146994|nr:hypothetical protein [Streptomyces sp. S07_1.15]MCC3654746.1 hypothetical protein [Streptomyces sp. S07_1.15]